jgi:DNA-3-methyladenine glycosylase II
MPSTKPNTKRPTTATMRRAASLPAANGDPALSLRKADPRLAAIIDRIGPYEIQLTRDPFAVLLGSIIHQQLSMKAAATIRGRVRALCPRGRTTPAAIAAIEPHALRAAGLSGQKVAYVRDLAAHFLDGRLTPRGLRRMSDDEAIAATTQVKGVGRWTAGMLLMFCLNRPDVWPIDDLGLRTALQRLTRARKPLSRDRLLRLGEAWRPHRTCATWYLWRSLDNPVLPGVSA